MFAVETACLLDSEWASVAIGGFLERMGASLGSGVSLVKSVGAVASADQVLLQTERAWAMAIIISRYVTEGAFTIAHSTEWALGSFYCSSFETHRASRITFLKSKRTSWSCVFKVSIGARSTGNRSLFQTERTTLSRARANVSQRAFAIISGLFSVTEWAFGSFHCVFTDTKRAAFVAVLKAERATRLACLDASVAERALSSTCIGWFLEEWASSVGSRVRILESMWAVTIINSGFRITVRTFALDHFVAIGQSVTVGTFLGEVAIESKWTSLAIIRVHKAMGATFGEVSAVVSVGALGSGD